MESSLQGRLSEIEQKLKEKIDMAVEQLYFRYEDSEYCFPLEYFLADAQADGLTEITLIKAIPDSDNKNFIWCNYIGECGERSECCKARCKYYQTRGNAKGGMCKYRGWIFQHGEKETFKLKKEQNEN